MSTPKKVAGRRRKITKKPAPKRTRLRQPDDQWTRNPQMVRAFIERRPDYEHLCAEVAYILKKKLTTHGIAFASVLFRPKTLSSFLEKLSRKPYADPFNEITDFAGVRVVTLYRNDLPAIEAIVRNEFDVLEKVDKLSDKGVNEFGYGAIHFIVRLGRGSSGARYDDVRHLVCEVQTRTVLQDAWAIIQHHLIYKHESDIPGVLQRKVNSLAGLLETADDQFESIRNERRVYVTDVSESLGKAESLLGTKIDVDSLTAYLRWKFPERPLSSDEEEVGMLRADLDPKKYKTLKDIDDVVQSTELDRKKVAHQDADRWLVDDKVPSLAEVVWALGLADESFRSNPHIDDATRSALESAIKPKRALKPKKK